jgi:signal peptidase I
MHMLAQPGPEPPKEPSGLLRLLFGRNPKRTLVRVLVLVIVLPILFTYVLRPFRVMGISMAPTHKDRSIHFVNHLAYLFREPRRGDIVAIRYSDEAISLMKRIVGMPGETIEFRQGRIFIDGHLLEEPYMDFQNRPCDWNMAPRQIGANEYYVVGDNRTMPARQHEQGIAPRERITGRFLL